MRTISGSHQVLLIVVLILFELWACKLVELTPTLQLAHPLSEVTGSADEFSTAEETESKLMFSTS